MPMFITQESIHAKGRMMKNFNNEAYKYLASDLIGDIFYAETSYRGKISEVRQYAEVIVRKILDINPDEKVTLGEKEIKNRICALPNHAFLMKAVNTIKGAGDKATHTRYLARMTEEEFETIMDSLFDMLAFLLINYFEVYEFGSRNDVLSSFSMLPPIIRYKVLSFLYEKNPDNVVAIDKLVLAILKAFDADEANAWIEEREWELRQKSTMTKEFKDGIMQKFEDEEELSLLLEMIGPQNMYELCKRKVEKVGNAIEQIGSLYLDFESALPVYKENGVLKGTEPEIQEFNDIMEFLYLGRKEKVKKICNEPLLFIMNMFS